ncbi:MAG: biotin--[acetyl-CoA-carboxylase] ligase [Chthoniobacteraceae bacterium]
MNAVDVALIRELRNARTHLSWSDLAEGTGLERAQVVARLAALQESGFAIEGKPGFGWRLIESPDRLMADDLFARLGPDPRWREIIVLNETDSTNERAAQLGRGGVAPDLVIFAEHQTAGRGRFGRHWASAPRVGLWFSILIRPSLPLDKWPRLTTWVAVSLARTIESALGIGLAIKWPNDLVLHGRKVAGILTELGTSTASEPFAVVGIGINVNQVLEDFPEELRDRATSLRLLNGVEVFRPALAAAILDDLSGTRAELESQFDPVVREAERRSSLLGNEISVAIGNETIDGNAEALDAEGRLVLRLADGTSHTLAAGEATLNPRR